MAYKNYNSNSSASKQMKSKDIMSGKTGMAKKAKKMEWNGKKLSSQKSGMASKKIKEKNMADSNSGMKGSGYPQSGPTI